MALLNTTIQTRLHCGPTAGMKMLSATMRIDCMM